MKKRVFIIHGWEGTPDLSWFPWLKNELEKYNFEVIVPQMPNPDWPKIEEWVPFLSQLAGKVDKNTFFIGHSIGCQTIIRLLETLNSPIGGAVFVAGWFKLKGLETKEEEELAKTWAESKIDFRKIKSVLLKSCAIFSDNDPFVDPIDNSNIFKNEIGSNIIILNNQEHFIENKELPIALEEILRIAK